MKADDFLHFKGASKSFGVVQALSDVSLGFKRGEIMGLVGENGAGKSTLMRLAGGVFALDSGELEIDGETRSFSSPREAHEAGIRVIHQEPEIIPNMTVAENIFVGNLPKSAGFAMNDRSLTKNTNQILEKFGMLGELAPRQLCEGLGPAQRQMIEIMRAVHAGGTVIAFDEPTSSLTNEEARRLFRIIRQLRDQDVAVIYISHRLQEIINLADRIAVLRDGKLVCVLSAEGVTEDKLTVNMVGRELSDMFPDRAADPGRVVLEVDRMNTEFVTDISLTLRAGEVLAIGGLVGAGRSELAKGIFGFHPRASGSVKLDGTELRSGSTGDAITAGLGFAPEDRKEEALLPLRSILDNAVLCIPDRVSRFGFFDRGAARRIVGEIAAQLAIKAPGLATPVSQLSGGNQQKVVLARWLARQPKVLILDEPTRGIDVGAKREIYSLIRDLTKAGLGLIVISSEMTELIGLADRILVMADGRITSELTGEEITEENILQAAIPRQTEAGTHDHHS